MSNYKREKTRKIETSSSDDSKRYLSRDEFIKKLKDNSLSIDNDNVILEEKKDRQYRNRQNHYSNYTTSKNRTRSSYRKSYTETKNTNISPTFSIIFLICIAMIKFIDFEMFDKLELTINNAISEVKTIEEMTDVLNFDVKSENSTFEERTAETVDSITNKSVEELKTMSNFEIEEDLFSEKK